jgi:hypothetical protein
LYSPLLIIRVNKSRRAKWEGQHARERRQMPKGFGWENLKECAHFEELGID